MRIVLPRVLQEEHVLGVVVRQFGGNRSQDAQEEQQDDDKETKHNPDSEIDCSRCVDLPYRNKNRRERECGRGKHDLGFGIIRADGCLCVGKVGPQEFKFMHRSPRNLLECTRAQSAGPPEPRHETTQRVSAWHPPCGPTSVHVIVCSCHSLTEADSSELISFSASTSKTKCPGSGFSRPISRQCESVLFTFDRLATMRAASSACVTFVGIRAIGPA